MKTVIQLYNNLKQIVKFFYKQLRLDKFENNKGRKLALKRTDTLSLAIFKQSNNIATKKSVYKIFKPKCSYKTLVVNINRFAHLALLVLVTILKANRSNQHFIKHTDSTEIPVCSNRKAEGHKTMKGLANWGYTGKGPFFGLKMHITTDLNRKMLAVRFTSGNTDDREIFLKLNKDLLGLFIADAGYVSKKLQQDFCREGKRMLLVKPRKNMKNPMTKFQEFLYGTRMLIELNFRNLKMFYGLVTSLPRSVGGYLANYIYSLLAYQIA
ncbi:MAG: transposase IS4 family protein [Parcubacteria group bacterium Athens1014_10]|nr:MAG: transposase IS4 family protein [Parcubacteria group bacterium Athens1014_10]TSD04798.1 MAG: transposase IS4 family protein [Parcubacteria group bacterium Athens0714_12]